MSDSSAACSSRRSAAGWGIFRIWPLRAALVKGRIGLLDANVNVAADKAKAGVAHHCAGKEARFAERLKTVCRDTEDHAAGAREFFDGLHDGREARDGTGGGDSRRRRSRRAG